jgi:hypothetical protein
MRSAGTSRIWRGSVALAAGAMLFMMATDPVRAANPSNSKLTIQSYHNYTTAAQQVLNAHPRIFKIIKNDTAMMDAARAFKASTPNGKVIIRPLNGYGAHYTTNDGPEGAAVDWFNNVTAPSLPAWNSPDRYLIDYVEGPNEGDSCPSFTNPTESTWYSRFWVRLSQAIYDAGYASCAGSMAVGNPPGDINNQNATIAAFVPALRQIKSMGGCWSYHSYTYYFGKDPAGIEMDYSLRYRRFYALFAQSYPDLVDMPMALTEAGGEGGGGGWMIHTDQAGFTDWLTWYDGQLLQDSYILGCTLFVSDGAHNGWTTYDTDPISPWLAGYLQGQAVLPSAPTELATTAGPQRVFLRWKGGYGSQSYNVRRSTTSGGPYTVVGSQIGGPLNPTWTDTSVTNGTTYYYVVAGVTPAGEGPACAELSATPLDGYRINCGGGSVGNFGGDAYYTNGTSWATSESINTSGVTNAGPAAMYQSERHAWPEVSSFSYSLNGLQPNANYYVRLHFAETYYSSSGARRFNVAINGTAVLSSFDIYAEAGARNKALVKSFTVAANGGGVMTINYTAGGADWPKASGIEILPAPPATPTGLAATAGSAQVSLTWSATTGATNYNVKRATTSGGPYTTVATVTTAGYTNTGLTNGTTYYYVVSAINAGGESSNSSQVSGTPNGPPAAPTNLTAQFGNAQAVLSWTAGAGATSYNVKRSTTNGGPHTTIATNVTTTTYTNTGLTNGTTYYYVVSSVNAVGESANSNQASATPSGVAAADDFEAMPSWSSTFDASWGNAASFTVVSGGQTANCMQGQRTGSGSSARAKVYTITPGTSYTLTIYIKCPSGSATYWAETAYKLGSYSAQDFDQNSGTWTMVKKFADNGTNGNGDTWTQYTATFSSGTNSQVTLGYKLGSSNTNGPIVKWDTLRIQAAGSTSPTIGVSPASLSTSTYTGSSPSSQTFTVQNTGAGTLNYSISDNQTWLSVSPASGTSTGPANTHTVTYATTGLAAGTYNATITITDANATNNPQTVTVTLTVNARPTISRSPASFARSIFTGTNASSDTFTVQNTGGNTLSYSISDDQTWLSVSPASGTSTGVANTHTITYATSGLAAGSYSATITITDPNASNNPQTIPVSLTVANRPTITRSPTSIAAACYVGGNAASQAFTVQNTGGSTLDYWISVDQTWLSVDPATGISTGGANTHTVVFNTSALAVGSYSATITISDPNASNNAQTIPVSLTVSARPTITRSPTSLSATTYTGASPSAQTFTVQNTGSSTLSYSISANQTWLSIAPTTGTSTGGANTHTVTYSTASLAAGTYSATITISDSNATNNPQTIAVSLTVLARPTITRSPATLSPSCNQGGNASSQTFTVQNTGSSTLSYSISVNQTWLSVTPTSGTSTGEADTITVNYATSSLAAGTYNAAITITDSNASNNPQTIAVTLTVNAVVVTVTENFDSLPNWSSTFDAAWGNAATFSVVTGGQSGNALQAQRSGIGSSGKVKVYNISANTNYTISVYVKCPSSSSYWAECACKLGSYSAQDFDQNGGTWSMIKKFASDGTNGNGNTWTQYSATFNSGSYTQISVGFKLGSSAGNGPTVLWDTLRVQ